MTTIYEKSRGIFLDIASCGSSIRWGVSVSKSKYNKKKPAYIHFSIDMTDCSRSISWDADGSPTLAKKKLRRAIATLTDALRAVEKAHEVLRRENAKK